MKRTPDELKKFTDPGDDKDLGTKQEEDEQAAREQAAEVATATATE